MEIIRKGSDIVFDAHPLTCCFPVGSNGYRVR